MNASMIARYAAVALPCANKAQNLKPDNTGYYRTILGAFDTCNHNGVAYPLLPSVRQLFEKGGIVRRRLDAGLCRSEFGHPKIQKMPLQDALERLAFIEPTLVCAHIKSVELVNGKDEYGKPIVLTVGMVKESGPYGESMKNQFDNPEENVAFSIRSFTTTQVSGGRQARIVKDIATWDYVTEPGIKHATQFESAGLESIVEDIVFNPEDLNKAIQTHHSMGLESDISSLRMVRDSLGWVKVQALNLGVLDWK